MEKLEKINFKKYFKINKAYKIVWKYNEEIVLCMWVTEDNVDLLFTEVGYYDNDNEITTINNENFKRYIFDFSKIMEVNNVDFSEKYINEIEKEIEDRIDYLVNLEKRYFKRKRFIKNRSFLWKLETLIFWDFFFEEKLRKKFKKYFY